jgi:tRNA(Ser,Leu) C12 N-acetylase TAN1
MKHKYQGKKIHELEIILQEKQFKYDKATSDLVSAISNKKDTETIEKYITIRNSYSFDLLKIKEQISNVSNRRNQYGEEIKEWNLRDFIN